MRRAWADISTPVPARHSPFASLLARFRGEEPTATCLIVFGQPTMDGPIIYQTYWNGEHQLDFTDAAELSAFLSDMTVDTPVRFVVQHTYLESNDEVRETKSMLESELWLIELSRRKGGNMFTR